MSKCTIICQWCGKEFQVYPSQDNRLYCSRACANRGRRFLEMREFDHTLQWERTEDGRWLCPYAETVSCKERNCRSCGWNPEVAQERLAKLRGAMAHG